MAKLTYGSVLPDQRKHQDIPAENGALKSGVALCLPPQSKTQAKLQSTPGCACFLECGGYDAAFLFCIVHKGAILIATFAALNQFDFIASGASMNGEDRAGGSGRRAVGIFQAMLCEVFAEFLEVVHLGTPDA